MAYFKDLFLNNLSLKLISLFFAATLWFYVTPIAPKDTLEVNYVLPLELKNIPPNMMTVGKIEERIGVRLKGGQGVIRDINPDKLSVSLDLSNASEGVRFYNLDPDNINVPSNIDVVRIEPRTIKIDMVKLKRKDVDVKVTLTGNPASGYRVKRISVNPAVITIEGPEAEVKDISSLEGLTINVTERKRSFSREVKIGTPQRNVRIIGKDVVIVDVEVDKS
ncbi:MAG: hypothetical protein HZC13_07435 [Nitrospirae bacterium]|nr:hypothetical protein [Nitrospirota bacterium]MBI5097551.1 hypothetical protein [Nitrospirota bacterium]